MKTEAQRYSEES